MVQFVGLARFVVAEVVQLLRHGTKGLHEASLLNGLVWLIGVNGIVAGSGHLFLPGPVADSIGWPRGTPWQWEVGLAGVGYGVLGEHNLSPGNAGAILYTDVLWPAVVVALYVTY